MPKKTAKFKKNGKAPEETNMRQDILNAISTFGSGGVSKAKKAIQDRKKKLDEI